jgi:hypothetical protein
MRLVKQSILYFKEGNSDKVYEIDLCDVGNDKYVVNFRYGRRYSKLKEGSKTPVPVILADAEKIFNEVEAEKISKGYSADGSVTAAPQVSTFTLITETTIGASFMSMPAGRTKGILQRLYNATQGNISSHRTKWKLSRIIWKAGEYKIPEAAQYIIKLFNKGDVVHQYSCTWALARCGTEANAAALQQIFTDHTSPVIKKIAGAGLLRVLSGTAKEEHLVMFVRSLPDALKSAIDANNASVLEAILEERIKNQESHYNWLETLYLIATEKNWMRPVIKKTLLQAPLKPGYFKHLRAVFKMAELLDDFEITGMLALRFERQPEFFKHTIPNNNIKAGIYLQDAKGLVNPNVELRKGNSRLAYSQRTRKYLRQRVNRRLQMYGHLDSLDYVKLATGILIAYNKSTDYKDAFYTTDYKWNGRNYTTVKTKYPQNAYAVFMHRILSGEHPELKLINNRVWRIRSEEELLANKKKPIASAKSNDKKGDTGLLKKISGIFGKKKEAAQTPSTPERSAASAVNENGTPFLHLWNKLPQSYVQLLMEAQMDEIHEFAQGGLLAHPQWNEIKDKLDKQACKQLLLSPFDIPAAFGFKITVEKFSAQQADAGLVIALLNSRNADARNKGREWTTQQLLQQSDFIKDLLFARDAAIFNWGLDLIKKSNLTSEIKKAVIGKCIAEYMAFTEMTKENEEIITRVTNALVEFFYSELHEVPLVVLEDLMQHDVPVVLMFGLQVLRLKQQAEGAQPVNQAVLFGLLEHSYEPIREVGLTFLNETAADTLLQYADEIILCCVSPYQSVRRGMGPVMARLAQKDRGFGEKAADLLMPFLLRKETSDGLLDDISSLLCNELSSYLQNANKELALNLLYGNYAAAQNVGIVILEKYTDPAQLTIPQVIALGGHENLQVRTWCWNFYKQQVTRIKFEKDAAVKLLDSKWADTRQFAMQFFREQFTENDWTPEALIALADSVKPDVEAYGRELITRYFTTGNGTTYLLKLTQHPSERMQLFATNYLERFAADDVEKIQSLEFYFRSVLTRVNKSRIAKNRIYHFLLTEGRKSEAAAKVIGAILSDVSAIAAIGDKAKCIEVLLQLRSLYEVETPLVVKEIETR